MRIPVLSKNISGKVVILRIDINSPIKNKKIINNERIERAAESIAFFKNKNAKVVVLAHQGRKGGSDFISLEQHARFINKRTKIKFIKDIFGKKSVEAIKSLKAGECLLLENVRFFENEIKYNKDHEVKFVKKLADLADYYVNDAFSVSHRKQASIVLFPEYLPSFLGINFVREIRALERIELGDALYILGGSKAEENAFFLKKGKKIIVAGIFGQMCMAAKGFKFGKQDSVFDKKGVDLLKKKIKGIEFLEPEDFAVDVKGKRIEIMKEGFPNNYEIFDIGKRTIKKFSERIRKAKIIFMKGPAGYTEDKKFRKGTKTLLSEIGKSRAFSVLGGGHLSTALKEMNINKKRFNHVSLSGGALASYVAGEKLPGLEAILNQQKVKKRKK